MRYPMELFGKSCLTCCRKASASALSLNHEGTGQSGAGLHIVRGQGNGVAEFLLRLGITAAGLMVGGKNEPAVDSIGVQLECLVQAGFGGIGLVGLELNERQVKVESPSPLGSVNGLMHGGDGVAIA